MRKARDGGKTGGKKREKKREKTDEKSGKYIIARRGLPERRPLERRTLAPKTRIFYDTIKFLSRSCIFPSTQDVLNS